MRQITREFRLGFGSFIDKTLLPFVDPRPEKRDKACATVDSCAPPYGYRHHMGLSDNANEFEQRVKRARISGNLDAPEGGFDAVVQALVEQFPH